MAEFDEPLPIGQEFTLESEEKSCVVNTTNTNVKFSQDISCIEIANNSETATIYLNIAGGVATTSSGIPIYAKQYYSANKKIKQDVGISLISTEVSTDVRIVGHFKFEE